MSSPLPTLPIDFESLSLALLSFAFKALASASSAGTGGSYRMRDGGPCILKQRQANAARNWEKEKGSKK